jgi:peptidoglycan/xylan/chitin deacetylase (PgdA/CDA1 family)
VNFHGVGKPARELEPGEDRYWITVDRLRWILDRIVGHPDSPDIRITFDDGNRSDLLLAAPELLARGLVARFFVLSGRIGEAGSLDRADLRDLVAAGMEIGSHGIDHVDWTGLDTPQLRDQLVRSKEAIEDIIGTGVEAAAAPFGRYNAAVLAQANHAGYAALYSSDRGTAQAMSFLKPRTSVTVDLSDAGLDRILSARLSVARKARRWMGIAMKQWL